MRTTPFGHACARARASGQRWGRARTPQIARQTGGGSASASTLPIASSQRSQRARIDRASYSFRRGYCRASSPTTRVRRVVVAMPRPATEVAAGLALSLLSCDRGKVAVAVHGLLAHMLAAVEQEESERYSDQPLRGERQASRWVPCCQSSEPPIIRTHGANASRRIEVPAPDGRADLRQTCGGPTRAFNEAREGRSAPSRYRNG